MFKWRPISISIVLRREKKTHFLLLDDNLIFWLCYPYLSRIQLYWFTFFSTKSHLVTSISKLSKFQGRVKGFKITWRRFPSWTSTSVPNEILLARDLRGSTVGSAESKLGICGAYTSLHLAWPNSPFPSILGINVSSVAVASFLNASCPSPSKMDSANWLSKTLAACGWKRLMRSNPLTSRTK